MAFSVQLYAFAKKLNSTARPTGTATEYNCVLKSGCGIMSPVISLDMGVLAAPTVYNYCYIPSFLRYYFIKEWYFEDRLWHAYLEEDPLATWKTYIGSTNLYILRAAARHNGAIQDNLYPTFPEPSIEYKYPSTDPFTDNLNSGRYVVGIINKSGAVGAVSYYVFTPAEFNTLKARLMSDSNWLDVSTDFMDGGIDDGLLRTLFNPFQYIVSCKWYPFEPPTTGAAITTLPYGWWDLNNISCHNLDPATNYKTTLIFDTLQHPANRIQTDNIYLNCEPFTRMELCVEPFGNIVIDSGNFSNFPVLRAYITVDCVTGIGILEVEKHISGGQTLGGSVKKVTGQFGVDIQLAQIAVDKLTQAETIITGGLETEARALETAGRATNISNLLNPVGGALDTMASGAQTAATGVHAIADGVRSSIPQMQTSGINGSIAAFSVKPYLKYTFYSQVTRDIQNDGLPLCQIMKPSDLATGYMLIKDGHVAFNGTANEIAAVKAYLESGFYYE